MGIESGTAQATFSAPPERPWDALPLEKRVDYLALYLRVAHNVCYYCAREFFDEDEMHMVCGRIHLRATEQAEYHTAAAAAAGTVAGSASTAPEFRALAKETDEFAEPRKMVDIPAVTGKSLRNAATTAFCLNNSQNVPGATVIACKLCSKKFMNQEYTNNHIIGKHSEELAKALAKDTEGLLKKNYMSDPHRIAPEADSSAVPVPLRPYKDLDSMDDTEAVNVYKSMFTKDEVMGDEPSDAKMN